MSTVHYAPTEKGKRLLDGIKAVVEAILEAVQAANDAGHGAPAGHLYAALMGHMSLHTFESIVGAMVAAGKLEYRGAHLLYITKERSNTNA